MPLGEKLNCLTMVTFGYAGPVIASIAFNVAGSAVATLCVYLYLHRDRFKGRRNLMALSRPLHGLITKIAKGKLDKIEKKRIDRAAQADQRPAA